MEAIVSHTDPSGRLVSELFQKLPSKVVSPQRVYGPQIMPLKLLLSPTDANIRIFTLAALIVLLVSLKVL